MKKTKSKKAPKTYVVPMTTKACPALKVLKWTLKPTRTKGSCIKVGCAKTGIATLWCVQHRKQLRKVQLKLNNIPWRKKRAKAGYKPTVPHLVYRGAVTPFAAKNREVAHKRIKAGFSRIVKSVKEFDALLTKQTVVTTKVKPKAKGPVKKVAPKSKPAPKAKAKAPKAPVLAAVPALKEFDATAA